MEFETMTFQRVLGYSTSAQGVLQIVVPLVKKCLCKTGIVCWCPVTMAG